MSTLPRQRGMTGFQSKRSVLSLTLTDQGQTNNLDITQLHNKILGFALVG